MTPHWYHSFDRLMTSARLLIREERSFPSANQTYITTIQIVLNFCRSVYIWTLLPLFKSFSPIASHSVEYTIVFHGCVWLLSQKENLSLVVTETVSLLAAIKQIKLMIKHSTYHHIDNPCLGPLNCNNSILVLKRSRCCIQTESFNMFSSVFLEFGDVLGHWMFPKLYCALD